MEYIAARSNSLIPRRAHQARESGNNVNIIPTMTPTFPLFASFVFEFQPSQHWSNFYATTRGPVLRWPQVAHDSSRASSMGFASAMSSLFEEESSGGIGYDQGEGLSRKIVISLCSHHCSHRSMLTFPTVPTITPPLSQYQPCRDRRKGRDLRAVYQVLYRPILATVFANISGPRMMRNGGTRKGQ